jgi:uncharacterized protein (DUF1499 family)
MAENTAHPGPIRTVLGLIAAAAVAAGPLLAYLRLVPALLGFALFALGGLLAVLVALASGVQLLRGRAFGIGGVASLAAALIFAAAALRTGGGPRINDFTTNPGNPPVFVALKIVGPNPSRDMSYPADYAAVQTECCADLAPLNVAADPATTFERARKAAESMEGWEVVDASAADGRVEAIATTPLFGFKDDVVIRVTPGPDGGSVVDIRSKSRDGQGDIGANAARIRAYLATVQSTS